MWEVDGALGEGGGQVLRSALAAAAATGTPVRIRRIRAGRRCPGLRPQHLTVVRALAALTAAEVEGDRLGSRELLFRPRTRPTSGEHRFDVATARRGGSAGAATLVLQTLHLPLVHAAGPSRLVVRGGTHVPQAPPFEHLAAVYAPVTSTLGAGLFPHLQRHGFLPAGGGEIHARITPAATIRPLQVEGPTPVLRIVIRAALAGVPLTPASRAVAQLRERLGDLAPQVLVEVRRVPADSPGGYLYVAVERMRLPAGFVALFGPDGEPEALVADLAAAVRAHLASGAVADGHLADQLILPLAFADGPSRLTTERASGHLLTQARLVEALGLARVRVDDSVRPVRVEVMPLASGGEDGGSRAPRD